MNQVYPSHTEQLGRLARIEGQLKGIRKMIEEGRYCIDIATQLKAAISGLKKVQLGVLEKHVHHCVKGAATSHDQAEIDQKIAEIVELFKWVE